MLLVDNFQKINRASTIKSIVQFDLLLGQVADNFALERGLTAGFLSGNGQQGLEELQKQRQAASLAKGRLLEAINTSTWPDTVQLQLKDLMQKLAAVEALRAAVDKRDANAKPFKVYSEINKNTS
ncbi:MAG: hypothetical protein RL497_771 [Pseudomonadota bacterium]|jgi:hypothetical protein